MNVYFIQAGLDGPIKIGKAANARRRLRALQTANVDELHLLATIPGGETLEAFLHGRFSAGQIRGEWFDPSTPGLADLIETAKRGAAPDWLVPYVTLRVVTVDELGWRERAAQVRHEDGN